MAGRGGKRPGSGRPKGSPNIRTRELTEKAAAEGMMPVDVMLTAMRLHVEAGRWDDAAKIAKDAAPYLHPRLAAIEHAGRDGGPIQFTGQTADEVRRELVDFFEARGLSLVDARKMN